MLALLLACSVPSGLFAADGPKLVVAISVDQFCQDYLIRFRDNFSDDGAFRRIAREGARYSQCHHRHAFTVTGPGHAVPTAMRSTLKWVACGRYNNGRPGSAVGPFLCHAGK